MLQQRTGIHVRPFLQQSEINSMYIYIKKSESAARHSSVQGSRQTHIASRKTQDKPGVESAKRAKVQTPHNVPEVWLGSFIASFGLFRQSDTPLKTFFGGFL